MSEWASLYFVSAGPHRAAVIRKVSHFLHIGLADAKSLVDSTEWLLVDGDTVSVVVAVKREFEALGAEVRIETYGATEPQS